VRVRWTGRYAGQRRAAGLLPDPLSLPGRSQLPPHRDRAV